MNGKETAQATLGTEFASLYAELIGRQMSHATLPSDMVVRRHPGVKSGRGTLAATNVKLESQKLGNMKTGMNEPRMFLSMTVEVRIPTVTRMKVENKPWGRETTEIEPALAFSDTAIVIEIERLDLNKFLNGKSGRMFLQTVKASIDGTDFESFVKGNAFTELLAGDDADGVLTLDDYTRYVYMCSLMDTVINVGKYLKRVLTTEFDPAIFAVS